MTDIKSLLPLDTFRRLQAKANAYIKVLVLTAKDAQQFVQAECIDSTAKNRTSLDEESLCCFCRVVDIGTVRGETDEEREYDLGFVQDIINNQQCSLCRLVRCSLELHWTSPPIRDKAGDLIRCHLFIPGPDYGHGRREIVVSPLVSDDELPQDVRALDRRHSLKLIVDDLKLVSPSADQTNSILARIVPPQCDFSFLRETFQTCIKEHGISCEWFKFLEIPQWATDQAILVEAKSYARGLRVIDVEAENIINAPVECRYVALSYVWGGTDFLRLQKDNLDELAKTGALAKAKVPKTIRDAMKLAGLLNERYLWVDALCIVQDDPNDKSTQIEQMDVIYSSAILTVVAASGTDSEAGLPGLESGTRQSGQHIVPIKGLRFVANGPELSQVMKTLRWNTRGWTFQELALSKRILCFTPKQCYFLCNAGVQSEDTVLEHAGIPRPYKQRSLDVFQLNTRSGLWQCYRDIVEKFSTREFTHENDINDGIDGLLNSLSTFEDEAFICGLPETLLDIALLWLPTGPLRTRKAHRNGEMFPTWSWTGWVGPVQYPSYLPPSQDIDAEITKWGIETSTGTYELYVNPSYITTGYRGSEPVQNTGQATPSTSRPFTPSPWRKALKHKDHSTENTNKTENSIPIDPLRSRIQTGILAFTARLATFVIYNSPNYHPATATRTTVNPPRRPCAILHQSDARPKRPSVVSWVGTVFIESQYAETLPQVFQGEFIILSSTNTSMLPLWTTRLTERPAEGLIYSETQFGSLPNENEDENADKKTTKMLYNVMWVEWGPKHASRRGIGQVHREGWELADSIARRIKLK